MAAFENLDAAGQREALGRLGATALQQYGLDKPVLTPLQHQENATFRFTTVDGAAYALRIGRPDFRPVRSVEAEMHWLAALHRDTDIRVPTPVETSHGHLTAVAGVPDVPQPRVCAVFEWIDGEFRHAGLTDTDLHAVGQMTARLQLHGSTFAPPRGNRRERIGLLTLAGRRVAAEVSGDPWRAALDNPDDERAALDLVRIFATTRLRTTEALLEELTAVKHRLGLGANSFGLMHGDLHQENYLFTPEGLGVIDFDDCGYFYHLYDLAVTISEISSLPHGAALRGALLDGYAGLCPLPDGYHRALDVFIAFRCLQNALWMIELRAHPAFQDAWEASVHRNFDAIGDLIAGSTD